MKHHFSIKEQQAILHLFDMVIVADKKIAPEESQFEQLLIEKFDFDQTVLMEPDGLSRPEAIAVLKKINQKQKEKIFSSLEKLADSDFVRSKEEDDVIEQLKKELTY